MRVSNPWWDYTQFPHSHWQASKLLAVRALLVLVIPGGITHNFVALTNTKTRTVFAPFGLLIVGPEGLEPPTSTV